MFHAWFYLLSYVLSTLWNNFHMISWTNLLTRATVLAACFPKDSRSQNMRRRWARGWPHPPRRGLGLAAPGHGVVAPGTPSVSLFAYKKPSDLKTEGGSTYFHAKFCSAATTEGEIRGTESLCSGTLPGRGSAPGAISIDLHHHLHHRCCFP